MDKLEKKAKERCILPLIVEDENHHITEVIYASSVSGGGDFSNDMPNSITLVRKTANGSTYRKRYVQEIISVDTEK